MGHEEGGCLRIRSVKKQSEKENKEVLNGI